VAGPLVIAVTLLVAVETVPAVATAVFILAYQLLVTNAGSGKSSETSILIDHRLSALEPE
jgi:hypothetical protein